MDDSKKSLEDLVRDELGDEPSQEAKDYARQLYERYRLPATEDAAPAAPASEE
ncbi:hypothetical protein GCM10007079_46230 [Nocardiopsis terrae]|uniref:Uncharacterized protein n=1 Tax=Nocardiopsis terrae TaxID=372655 RepID=A0ABR9HKL5_9ACTN|nr:hypothetical protein [Nocardiopsis terrae]MBE1459569.1 hypothetical protein [Nocardiopsis terrae]GHC95033.1 hypothetical protein GCM10007079_46230 [Nocardiopsis terrae]